MPAAIGWAIAAALLLQAIPAGAADGLAGSETRIRVGHFPNITHAQAVIGRGLSRAGRGWFEERLGSGARVQWFVYNAGPTAMEALLAGSIDIAYVGPNPAVNAYIRTAGRDIRIVAGACSGGAALVVQPDGRIAKDSDFKGRKVATPQFGNTQDVAARAWLQSKGYRIRMNGGDVLVVPTSNPDQLLLFRKGELDAVWTVEPWVSRLVLEANAKVYLEESSLWPETGGKYVTTHLVTSVRFLKFHPDLLEKWIAAQVDLTLWIKDHTREAKEILNREIKAETTRGLPAVVLEKAWRNLELTYDPVELSLMKSAEAAYRIGFLRKKPELAGIYDLQLLNGVLREKKLPEAH